MFNSKKIKQLEERIEKIEEGKIHTKECSECGCLINKENAKIVKNRYFGIEHYYCKEHKPSYDEIGIGFDHKTKYSKNNVEVNKNGKPIKK